MRERECECECEFEQEPRNYHKIFKCLAEINFSSNLQRMNKRNKQANANANEQLYYSNKRRTN